MKKRVLVAMSGGVDSSTVAALLLEQGYEVIGGCMKLSDSEEDPESSCCGIRGIDDARDVAGKIEIPFYVFDYEREFEDKIIDYFLKEYGSGRTPNPCVICNERIKFGSLLEKSRGIADYFATGHYARIEYDKTKRRYILKKGRDREKDQSYFLFSLSQEQLSRSLFPLGEYTKKDVRRLAGEFGLKVHNKPASQEICFIPNADYRGFLKTQITADKFMPGPIVNKDGKILGEHHGIPFYTIGQRKGIGAHKRPFYVITIDKEKNTVVIGEDRELYRDVVIVENLNWVDRDGLTGPTMVRAKIRYRHKGGEAEIFPLVDGKVELRFAQPQRAITPGQATVFYDDETVVGGGWISQS